MFLKAVCDQLHLFTYSILALEEHVLHTDWLVILFKCNNTVFWKLVDFVLKCQCCKSKSSCMRKTKVRVTATETFIFSYLDPKQLYGLLLITLAALVLANKDFAINSLANVHVVITSI